MNYRAHLPVACATLLLLASAAAANDEDTGAWAIVSTSDGIAWHGEPTAWRYAADAQWRHFNRGAGSNQYVLRPAIGYVLRNEVALWAGYGYFLTAPDSGSNRYEHRWWQQVAWPAHRWDWGTLSLRTRLEERIVEHGDDTGLRLRQQVQLLVPLAGSDLSLAASVEPYVNLRDTDWGARSGLDQNRSYIGLRMPMSDAVSLEAGYMHQYIRRSGPDVVNHLGVLHLRVRF